METGHDGGLYLERGRGAVPVLKDFLLSGNCQRKKKGVERLRLDISDLVCPKPVLRECPFLSGVFQLREMIWNALLLCCQIP